jgi:hypothetical protein
MSVATTTAIGIAAAVSAGAGVAGSVYGANKQADATGKATDATSAAAANSLAFNKQVYGDTQTNEAPYRDAGAAAVNQLSSGLSDGSLTAAYPGGPFSFSGVNEANDPAYQFDLSQGQQAVQRSAAASGGLVSGGAMKDLDTFSQGFASNQYQQSYANSLAAYNQAYNQFETTQSNKFNRLSSVAGLGQNAVTQTATSGNAAAGTNAAVNTSTANSLADLYTGQANSGVAAIGAGTNAITGGVNNYANSLSGSSYGSGTQMAPGEYDDWLHPGGGGSGSSSGVTIV